MHKWIFICASFMLQLKYKSTREEGGLFIIMTSIREAIVERERLLARTTGKAPLPFEAYQKDVVRYVNLGEYKTLLDNLEYFLKICPRSMDFKKCKTYWVYLKSYLGGIRYAKKLENLLVAEAKKVESLNLETADSFVEEMKRFLSKEFLPVWVSCWDI